MKCCGAEAGSRGRAILDFHTGATALEEPLRSGAIAADSAEALYKEFADKAQKWKPPAFREGCTDEAQRILAKVASSH